MHIFVFVGFIADGHGEYLCTDVTNIPYLQVSFETFLLHFVYVYNRQLFLTVKLTPLMQLHVINESLRPKCNA